MIGNEWITRRELSCIPRMPKVVASWWAVKSTILEFRTERTSGLQILRKAALLFGDENKERGGEINLGLWVSSKLSFSWMIQKVIGEGIYSTTGCVHMWSDIKGDQEVVRKMHLVFIGWASLRCVNYLQVLICGCFWDSGLSCFDLKFSSAFIFHPFHFH